MSEEGNIKRAIIAALEAIPGLHVMRFNAGFARMRGFTVPLCEPGTPDLMVMLPDERVVWLEVKTTDKASKENKAQENWHAMARKLGHAVYVVRSVQEAVAIVKQRRDAA